MLAKAPPKRVYVKGTVFLKYVSRNKNSTIELSNGSDSFSSNLYVGFIHGDKNRSPHLQNESIFHHLSVTSSF